MIAFSIVLYTCELLFQDTIDRLQMKFALFVINGVLIVGCKLYR